MAFPASVLPQLSRQPQNEAQNWILGIVANGLLVQLDSMYLEVSSGPFTGPIARVVPVMLGCIVHEWMVVYYETLCEEIIPHCDYSPILNNLLIARDLTRYGTLVTSL